MPNLHNTINDIVVGDSYDIVRNIGLVPTGQYITSATLSIKEDLWDVAYILQKTISSALSSSGIIDDTGVGDSIGKVTFILNSADTKNFKPYFKYVYDIQMTTNLNKVYTPETGTLTANAEVTV